MNRLLILILSFSLTFGYAQVKIPEYEKISGNAHQLIQHLSSFEKFGVKEPGTIALNQTRDWLYAYYQSLGYQTILDSFNYNSLTLENIVAFKKGLSESYIIVCGHYDTRTGPGANDNGSGVSVIMEMARLLAPVETELGIKFIHFSGEESGLLGSTHYANFKVGTNDTNLALVFNLDQLGGTKGASGNYKIKCEYDQDVNPDGNNTESKRLTDSLALWMSVYSDIEPQLDRAYSSDYIPFENLGYVITGLYQYSDYPPYHTANDVLAAMDTLSLKELAKGSIGALLHFVQAKISAGVTENSKPIEIQLYPNPGNGLVCIKGELNFEYPIKVIFSSPTGSNIETRVIHSPLSEIELPETGTNFRIDILDQKKRHYRSQWLVRLKNEP